MARKNNLWNEVTKYHLRLLRQWGFLVAGPVGVVLFILAAFLVDVQMPQLIYLVLGFIAVLCGGFQIHQHDMRTNSNKVEELTSKIEELTAQIEEYENPHRSEPTLVIMLDESNPFTYELMPNAVKTAFLEQQAYWSNKVKTAKTNKQRQDAIDTLERINKDFAQAELSDSPLPAQIIIRVRIINSGNTSVDILSVHCIFPQEDTFWSFSRAEARIITQPPTKYPVRVALGEEQLFELVSSISPRIANNSALLAVHIGGITAIEPNYVGCQIMAEAVNPDAPGNQVTTQADFSITTRPLKEKYLQEWYRTNRSDLLRLAQAEHRTFGQQESYII